MLKPGASFSDEPSTQLVWYVVNRYTDKSERTSKAELRESAGLMGVPENVPNTALTELTVVTRGTTYKVQKHVKFNHFVKGQNLLRYCTWYIYLNTDTSLARVPTPRIFIIFITVSNIEAYLHHLIHGRFCWVVFLTRFANTGLIPPACEQSTIWTRNTSNRERLYNQSVRTKCFDLSLCRTISDRIISKAIHSIWNSQFV